MPPIHPSLTSCQIFTRGITLTKSNHLFEFRVSERGLRLPHQIDPKRFITVGCGQPACSPAHRERPDRNTEAPARPARPARPAIRCGSDVSGTSCGHCASAVAAVELENLTGVTAVAVDVDAGVATVTADRELGADEAWDEVGRSATARNAVADRPVEVHRISVRSPRRCPCRSSETLRLLVVRDDVIKQLRDRAVLGTDLRVAGHRVQSGVRDH